MKGALCVNDLLISVAGGVDIQYNDIINSIDFCNDYRSNAHLIIFYQRPPIQKMDKTYELLELSYRSVIMELKQEWKNERPTEADARKNIDDFKKAMNEAYKYKRAERAKNITSVDMSANAESNERIGDYIKGKLPELYKLAGIPDEEEGPPSYEEAIRDADRRGARND